jgi:hypothetical protein
MLKELHESLTADHHYITTHSLVRNSKTSKSVDYFHALIKSEERPLDSMRYYLDWLQYGLYFQINKGPYESLKSLGVDRISNDSLRNQIVNYYDFVVPRNSKLIAWAQDETLEKGSELKDEIMDPYRSSIVEGEVRVYRPTPDTSILRNPQFLELLSKAKFRSSWTEDQYKELLSSLIPLLEHIETELSK